MWLWRGNIWMITCTALPHRRDVPIVHKPTSHHNTHPISSLTPNLNTIKQNQNQKPQKWSPPTHHHPTPKPNKPSNPPPPPPTPRLNHQPPTSKSPQPTKHATESRPRSGAAWKTNRGLSLPAGCGNTTRQRTTSSSSTRGSSPRGVSGTIRMMMMSIWLV